jgi:hypothetical protein
LSANSINFINHRLHPLSHSTLQLAVVNCHK